MHAMASTRTTIDKQGRVAIPKAIRDRARLAPGDEVEIDVLAGVVEIRRLERADILKETERGLLTFSSSLGLKTPKEAREAIEEARGQGC